MAKKSGAQKRKSSKGSTLDPGQRGQGPSEIVRYNSWKKQNEALNKAVNDLNKYFDSLYAIPPGQQSGRPRPKPKSKPKPMPNRPYKKSGPGFA